MPTLNPSEANAWQRFVQDYDNTSRLFQQAYSDLQRLGPYVRERHPELLNKYNSLVARGGQHQAQLAQLAQVRQQVGGWLTSLGRNIASVAAQYATFSQQAFNWLRERVGLGGMAAVPVVAVVVGVAAAAAVITIVARWIIEAYEFTQRLNALERLERQGVSPQEAARIVNQTVGAPSGPSIMGIPIIWIAAGVALIVIGPPLLNKVLGNK